MAMLLHRQIQTGYKHHLGARKQLVSAHLSQHSISSTTTTARACHVSVASGHGLRTRRTWGVRSVATESLTGHPLVLGSYDEAVFEPSNDLRELAAAQLQSLFQVLRRVSPGSHNSCKACVYARRADSLDAPQMKLQRVACCKSAQLSSSSAFGFSSSSSNPDSNNSFEELDEVLTLHRAAWEPGNSSSGSSGCETEALLINEEIVLLPSSNLLVLPIAEAGVLVGMLVVEVHNKPGGPVPHQPQPLEQQQQDQQGQPVWELPPVLGLSEDVLWALRMCVGPLAKACAMDLRTALAGAQQEARQRLARSLLLEARGPLKVLGTFGTMLAPRLRTGQTGEPESDMADGMLLQGQRLADVVAQLEAALRPAPRAPPVTPGWQDSSSSSGISGSWRVLDSSSSSSSSSDASQRQQQQPWREPLALPAAVLDDGNVSDEDDSWAVADSPAQQLQMQQAQQPSPASGSTAAVMVQSQVVPPPQYSPSSSSSTLLLPGPGSVPVVQQPQQVVVDLVPGVHTADSLESSSRDIRWSSVKPPVARPRAALPAGAAASQAASSSPILGSSTSSSSPSRSSSSSVTSSSSMYAAMAGDLDAAKTIDLEPQLSDNTSFASSSSTSDNSSSSSSDGVLPAAALTKGSSQLQRSMVDGTGSDQRLVQQRRQQQQQQLNRPVQQFKCNVVDVLSHLLAAVAGLAQAQGVNLIVNDPLTLDPPLSSKAGSFSSSGLSSSSSTALVLLPRPVRPLIAGVAGNVCRRVLGYCMDVALQCTPRGGQLCVTARASSGGVEVSLMHTGQVQPDRWHTSTASLDAAALGAAAAAALGAAAAAAQAPAPALAGEGAGVQQPVGAAGSLVGKRKRQQATSSSSSSSSSGGANTNLTTSSSSSRWSAGLQELSSGSGIRGGSSLITLDFARQILQSIGGRLSLTYPYHFMNAITGQLEVGSNIEVWLPPPAPSAG